MQQFRAANNKLFSHYSKQNFSFISKTRKFV